MPANTRRLGFCMFLVATAALHAEEKPFDQEQKSASCRCQPPRREGVAPLTKRACHCGECENVALKPEGTVPVGRGRALRPAVFLTFSPLHLACFTTRKERSCDCAEHRHGVQP